MHTHPPRILPLRHANRLPPPAAGSGVCPSRAPSALWPGPPAPHSHALRPVTTGNAFSAMSYRNCWHIFGPRLGGWRRSLRPPRLALNTAPGAETLDRALAQWLRFLTAANGGAIPGPRWLADRPAQLGIVGCRGTPNPARAHPTAAMPAPRAAGSVGQRLMSYAPLGRPSPGGPGPNLHVSGARRAFAPNHSQIYPPAGLTSTAASGTRLFGWGRRLRLPPARPRGVRPGAGLVSACRPRRLQG